MADTPEREPITRGQMRRVCDSSIELVGEPEFVLDVPEGTKLAKGQMRRVCDSSFELTGEVEFSAEPSVAAGRPVLFLTLHLPSGVDAATVAIETTQLVETIRQLDQTYGGSGLTLDRPR